MENSQGELNVGRGSGARMSGMGFSGLDAGGVRRGVTRDSVVSSGEEKSRSCERPTLHAQNTL